MTARELTIVAITTLVIGSLYCAAYCRIAFQPMHSGAMPLWLSAWWATAALLPWLMAFESVKRLLPRQDRWLSKVLIFAGIACATAALTLTAARYTSAGMHWMMSADWHTVAANQLQPLLLFVILSSLWAIEALPANGDSAARQTEGSALPPLHTIDWIQAAGNYVELRCGDRLLIRRMTMRSAEAAVAGAGFIRVHRSILVRCELISGYAGNDRSRIMLKTGEALPVGDSYRRGVERMVTSSLGFGPSAHSIS